jgi:hypothetical protein
VVGVTGGDGSIVPLFERGDLVAEAEPSYRGGTGERTAFDLHLYRRGPRGGKRTIWRGEPDELRWLQFALSDVMEAASRLVPDRIPT